MGGIPCADKVLRNYAILSAEAVAFSTPGDQTVKEAAALAVAAEACCMAYPYAYDDPNIGDDDRARLVAVMRAEGADAVAMAAKLRGWRDHGSHTLASSSALSDAAMEIRACRDKMVKAFGDVFDELMAEYYP